MAYVAAPPSILPYSPLQRLQHSQTGILICANSSRTFRNSSSCRLRCHLSIVREHDSLSPRPPKHPAEPILKPRFSKFLYPIRPKFARCRPPSVSSSASQSANESSPYFPYPSNSPAALRHLISSPGLARGPACYDALSAALVEQAGFPLTFISGEFN